VKRMWKASWSLSSIEKEISSTFTILEQDKSNLQLYLVNTFGSTFYQFASMSNYSGTNPQALTGEQTEEEDYADYQVALIREETGDRARKGTKNGTRDMIPKAPLMEDSQTSTADKAASSIETRDWNDCATKGKEAVAIYGDQGRPRGDPPSGGRTWRKLRSEREKSKVVYGETYAD